MCSFGHNIKKKDIKLLASRRGLWRRWRVWRGSLTRSSWDHLVCLAWGRGDWEETSLQPQGSEGAGTNLFTLMTIGRTQGIGMKLIQGRFRLDIRKRLFTQKMAEYWNRLPREIITAPMLSSVQEAFGKGSQAHMWILGVSCTVVLDDSDGSLSTQPIL